jgi:hypothetical protein
MGEIVADEVLGALSTTEYRALLERLPDQADELRKRRKALQHAAWRERNRDKKFAWDIRYYHHTSAETPEQKRERWRAATRRLRARRKRAELEPQLIALQKEMKGTRGKQRELLKARMYELDQKIDRLTEIAEG